MVAALGVQALNSQKARKEENTTMVVRKDGDQHGLDCTDSPVEKVEHLEGGLEGDFCIAMPGGASGPGEYRPFGRPRTACGSPWETLPLDQAYRVYSNWGRRAHQELGGDEQCCHMCRYNVSMLSELGSLGDRWIGVV